MNSNLLLTLPDSPQGAEKRLAKQNAVVSPSNNSAAEYHLPHQTMLLLDWDDTCCPSTFCRSTLPDELVCAVWQECCGNAEQEEESVAAAAPQTYHEAWNKDLEGNHNTSSPRTKPVQLRDVSNHARKNDEASSPYYSHGSGMGMKRPEPLSFAAAGNGVAEYHEEIKAKVSPVSPKARPMEAGLVRAIALHKKHVSPAHSQTLDEIADLLIKLLKQAQKCGKVVIVTNAETGWIELSCKAWMPRAYAYVKDCELVSARSTYEPQGVLSPAGWKSRAFDAACAQFYGQDRSWKNIVSIGDAPHEREAVFRLEKKHPHARLKALKLQIRPRPALLMDQLKYLVEYLPHVVGCDGCLDLQFDPKTANFVASTAPRRG